MPLYNEVVDNKNCIQVHNIETFLYRNDNYHIRIHTNIVCIEFFTFAAMLEDVRNYFQEMFSCVNIILVNTMEQDCISFSVFAEGYKGIYDGF